MLAAIKNWELGDMPSFEDSISLALNGGNGQPGLIASNARAKHIVLITDDDPLMPDNVADPTADRPQNQRFGNHDLSPSGGQYRSGGSRIGAEDRRKIIRAARGTILTPLPQIFIKEATVVKRSIIQEDAHGFPCVWRPRAAIW